MTEYKEGDAVEFLSDRQTEKGPSAGIILTVFGTHIRVRHSDEEEAFDTLRIQLERKTKHHDGRVLWQFK